MDFYTSIVTQQKKKSLRGTRLITYFITFQRQVYYRIMTRALISAHLVSHPWPQVSYVSVDTVLSAGCATMTPARGTFQIPLASELTHQGTPTVSLTGVYSPLIISCAQHGVMDLSWISTQTALLGYQWHWCLHEDSGWWTAGGKGAPSCSQQDAQRNKCT